MLTIRQSKFGESRLGSHCASHFFVAEREQLFILLRSTSMPDRSRPVSKAYRQAQRSGLARRIAGEIGLIFGAQACRVR